MRLVAPGSLEQLEDRETLELVTELGVDYGQGYAIGRPAPLEETILRAG